MSSVQDVAAEPTGGVTRPRIHGAEDMRHGYG
jgi:hypothetical protein